jgi:hypothetical protein
MATSLVSTGVQFPDSSIQTTAAGAGGAWVFLSTVTATGASTADIESTFDSTYDTYCIIANDVSLSTGSILNARLKIGGTYETSNYAFATNVTSGSSYSGSTGGSTSSIEIATNINKAFSAANVFFTMTVYSPTLSLRKIVTWSGAHGSNAQGNTASGVAQQTTQNTLTGVRFLSVSGGTITGTFRLYGIKNS